MRLSLILFFLYSTSLFCHHYTLNKLTEERIQKAVHVIQADFYMNERLRIAANTGALAVVIAMVYAGYTIWRGLPECSHQIEDKELFDITQSLKEKNKRKLIDIGHDLQHKQQLENVPSFIRRTGGSAIGVARYIMPKILTDLTVSFSLQRWLMPLNNYIDGILRERTIMWYITHRTRLLLLIEQAKKCSVILDPHSTVFESISGITLSAEQETVDSSTTLAPLNELITLKTQALAVRENRMSTDEVHLVSQQLIALMQYIVFDIEGVLAFIAYRYPDEKQVGLALRYHIEHLVGQVELSLNTQQFNGLLASIFQLAQQLEQAITQISLVEQGVETV